MKPLHSALAALALMWTTQAFAYESADLEIARKLHSEKSYQLAETELQKFVQDKTTDAAAAREMNFLWADSVLRGKAEGKREEARKKLQELATSKDIDRWSAEAMESLAQDDIEKDPYGKLQDIKNNLDAARNYWAGSSDIDAARAKFITLSFSLADYITAHQGWYATDIKPIRLESTDASAPALQGNQGLQILFEEVLKIAKEDNDKAHAHYGLAMAYNQNYSGDAKLREKARDHFKTIVDDFSKSEWADDAYYQMGQGYENEGDFIKATEIYKDFLAHYKAGESSWVDDVARRLEYITGPQLQVNVSNTFTSGSEVQFSLNWRNVTKADVAFYKLDLAKEITASGNSGTGNYQDVLRRLVDEAGRYASLPKALGFTLDLKDDGKYVQHGESKGLAEWRSKGDEKADAKNGILPTGAYLLLITAPNGKKSYDLVVVSDVALASKISKDTALFFTADAKTGKPIASATVQYAYTYYDEHGSTQWEAGTGKSDENGLFKAALHANQNRQYSNQHSVFAAMTAGDQQAFVQGNYYQNSNNNKGDWWFYAFTDRPAYRPNETVSFKAVLRQPQNGGFLNPAGKQVKARIINAQGAQVKEATYSLNEFGALSDTLVLDEKAVLGEYRLELRAAENDQFLATTPLFRLEEYKLPEFVVNVQAKPKEDKTSIAAYRLGDTVTVDVDAQYYFGGAVANAQVEYLVYQTPYYQQYQPTRAYGWYYDDMYPHNNNYYGGGTLVKQEKITTDANGKASFKIETPKDSGNDLKYHVEVRVTDKSRREIIGGSDIKVTKNAFFVSLEPQQNLYRPGDKVKVNIKTLTANETPVAIDGKVSITRNTWRDPVIQNDKVASPGGYNGQETLTKFIKTNDKGEAVFEFEPDADGYYTVTFAGFDEGRAVIGSANIYVCAESSKNIGYRYGGLQIITEKDTYAVGETARAMIVTENPDTWVLFTTEADDVLDYRMVHVEGTVKLIDVPVTANFTPNVFLNALSADHYQLKTTMLQVVVPPSDKFLNVTVTSDKKVYEPREEGVFDVVVTDKNGKPVSGEVALGITDDAVYAIQSELAPDIRQFFYGDKRMQSVQTQASFYQRPYLHLVRGDSNELITDEERDRRKVGDDKGAVNAATLGGAIGSVLKQGFARQEAVLEEKAQFKSKDVALASPAMEMSDSKADADGVMDKLFAKKVAAAPEALNKKEMDGNGAGSDASAETVRNDFRSTVIWQPTVKTDANGKAQVRVTFPDSLTTWRFTARALTAETSVGTVTYNVKSNKNLMVRLQAPRFFTERDLTAVSALVDNLSDEPQRVAVTLKAEGAVVSGLYVHGQFVKGELAPVDVPAHGQSRVDWAVSTQKAGNVTFTVLAKAPKLSDAMQKTYPIIPHGIDKFLAQGAVLKSDGGEQSKEVSFVLPKERIKETAHLHVTVSPSLAANLMDALPYLADYPYGCVEQTMSRFLPAVIVDKTMRDLGISQNDVQAYIGDVLEPRHDPEGHPQRTTQASYTKLASMTKGGLQRLYDFQHADGGWGWWKEGESDRFMSAYTLWGVALAREAGVDVRNDVIANAAAYLQKQLVEEENAPDMLAWMLHALAESGSKSAFEDKQRQRLWDMRDKLNPYTRALFALSEHKRGDVERGRVLAQNLANGVIEDKENATAHWGEAGVHYRWSEGGVEATAFVIKALSQIAPESPYLEPAVKWLSLNRRGGSWKNTRDTAIAILGLSEYLKASHELNPDYTYEVFVNGASVRKGKADSSNVFSFNRNIDIPAESLRDGENTVKVTMKGKGALYLASHATFFTLEEGITKAGNEVFVTRQYFKKSTKETLMKGYTEDWTPIKDGDELKSGDRVRVDITLEAKNHYEYVLSEDYKPAGLEAVELKSGVGEAIVLSADGHETAERTPLYQEFRDQKAAFFISKLKQGKHLLRYELRAEVPGHFHAMPNQAHAMYVPEIRSNSDEMRLNVGGE